MNQNLKNDYSTLVESEIVDEIEFYKNYESPINAELNLIERWRGIIQ